MVLNFLFKAVFISKSPYTNKNSLIYKTTFDAKNVETKEAPKAIRSVLHILRPSVQIFISEFQKFSHVSVFPYLLVIFAVFN